jgi:AraC-like DNA-binding protein
MSKPIPIITIEQLNSCGHHITMNVDVRRLEVHAKTLTPADFPHRHDFYNLIYIKQGSGWHDIDFRRFKIEPNQLFFMNEGQVHEWFLSEDTVGYTFFFKKEFYDITDKHLSLSTLPFLNNSNNDIPLVMFDESDAALVETAFERIIEEYAQKKPHYEALINTLLKQLFIYSLRVYQPNFKDETAVLNVEKIRQFEALIEIHFRSYKLVKDYADLMNITPNYLNAVCNKTVGRKAGDLIRDRVLLEAKRLLLYSTMSVCEMAYHLGYEDCSYFIRVFKKEVKQTPEQFRLDRQ